MKAYLDCYPCFFVQTLNTMRLITSDEEEIWKVLKSVSSFLPELSFDSTPPEIGREIYRIISDMTGVKDPYRDIKKRCTQQALSLYPNIKEKVEKSDNGLLTAVKAAVAGNIIDFGAQAEFDIKEDLDRILKQDFAVNEFERFATVYINQAGCITLRNIQRQVGKWCGNQDIGMHTGIFDKETIT